MSILSKLYMNGREQAIHDILRIYQEYGSCIVHFLYFSNVMHQRLLEGTPLISQQKYLDSLENADFCLADGIALQLFYKFGPLGKGICMPYNLNGTDFNPYLFQQLSKDHNVSVYLYQCYDPPKGKDLAFVQKGINALKERFPNIRLPWSDQCLFREKGKNFNRSGLEETVANDRSEIKIFFNCTGTPFQEIRAMEHEQKLRELGFLVISAGGTIDFMTGFEKRAPERVIKARVLETFWRICSLPQKNFKKFWWMFGIFRFRINRLANFGLGITKSNTILGFGREGQSTYHFLIDQGYDPDCILVRDKNFQGILRHGGKLLSGDNYLKGIENDISIWRAPGITLHMMVEQGVDVDKIRQKLVSQTEYFLHHYKGIVIGVTGTKGKSTVSTMIYDMIRDSGSSVILAGNVGKPIFDMISFKNPPDYVIYELSSYMLESLNQSDWMIEYGIITSLFPHVHVKEHGSQESYIFAKMEILKHSRKQIIGSQTIKIIQNSRFKIQNSLVFGQPIPDNFAYDQAGGQLHSGVSCSDGYFWNDGKELFETSCVQLLGEHNLYNVCAVITVGLALGIPLESMKQTITTFQGLEHRLEYVGQFGGIDRYNDAIATTPDATLAAINSFEHRLGTLFLGGIEGPYQFDEVVEGCKTFQVPNVILFPDTGARIKTLLLEKGYEGKIFEAFSMEEAVIIAFQQTPVGSVALLSCGSPSFSLWRGYEQKGRLFKESITKTLIS